jgi:internalin A
MKYTFKDLQKMKRLKNVGEIFIFDDKTIDYEFVDLNRNNDLKEIRFERPQEKLLYLDASFCTIEQIVIKNCPNLQKLYLNNNQLSSIQFEGQFEKLEMIVLDRNHLNELDLQSENFPELHYLYLYHNQLEDLSGLAEFFIRKGFDFNIDKNENLHSPQPEIVSRGKSAIIAYFEAIQTSSEDYLYEARMLIIGESGSGKTTLARRLIDPKAPMPEEKDTTKGIDVFRWIYKTDTANGKMKMRVNIWDFGGQSIYKATHRFFLSHRALYVLLTDGRKEDTDFNYWLNLAEMFGGKSPVIIVMNIKEKREYNLPINTLQGRFDNLKEATKLDLKEIDQNYGILLKKLKYHISELPHIGSKLPKSWTTIRKDIENLKDKYISHQQFFSICEKNGVNEIEKILQISQFFHDIGVFLHFQDHPQLGKILFLKNDWALDAAYAIIDDPKIKKQNGYFSKADAIAIWGNDYYMVFDDLLALMKRFYLVYEIGNSQNYIAPQLLLDDKPVYEWDDSENLQLRYEYDDFMPQGILWQFVATMHKQIKNDTLVWRSGVIISEGSTDAEITEVYGKHKINIRIRGKNKSEMRTIIAYELDKINKQYAKLKFEKLVPCTCHGCKNNPEPHFYKYSDLLRRKEKGVAKVQCEKTYLEVSVIELLEGIGLPKSLEPFIEKEKKGNELILDLLIDKKIQLEKDLAIAYDSNQKFALEKQVKELERQIEELKKKV